MIVGPSPGAVQWGPNMSKIGQPTKVRYYLLLKVSREWNKYFYSLKT